MVKEKKEYSMSNAAAVAAGVIWYPFAEATGAPSDKDVEDNFPLRAAVFENKSGETYTLVLNPVAGSSAKSWTVPNGNTFMLESREDINFYQISCTNNGALETAIGELKVQVRNY